MRKRGYFLFGNILFSFGIGFGLGAVESLILVSMYDVIPIMKIRNKADAMQFAINTTLQYRCGEGNEGNEGNKVDYEEAEKLFNFICDHVEFPEDDTKRMTDGVMTMLESLLQKEVV